MGGRGSGGHNKKSARVRQLDGNPGHRPIADDPAPVAVELPACPRFLDREAKKQWRLVIKQMQRAGTITREAGGILAAYCTAYSVFMKAQQGLMDADGGMTLTQPARHGEVARPEVKIAREARAQMRALAAELGLTPKSRLDKTSASGKPQDPLDKALGTRSMN